MIEQHRACLAAMTSAAGCVAAQTPGGDIGAPEVGLPFVLFAGELAEALQPGQFRGELPASLLRATITTATLAAAGCLADLVGAVQTLSALTRYTSPCPPAAQPSAARSQLWLPY